MQAIRTRYHGPTNAKDSRISAKCEAGQILMSYRYELNIEENHKAACEMLREKLGWNTPYYTPMVAGCFDGDYYHVFTERA